MESVQEVESWANEVVRQGEENAEGEKMEDRTKDEERMEDGEKPTSALVLCRVQHRISACLFH